jgi:hypothetical protein
MKGRAKLATPKPQGSAVAVQKSAHWDDGVDRLYAVPR